MADIRGVLTKRIGPAPVWVYGAIGVLGLAWYLRRNAGTSSTAQTKIADEDAIPIQRVHYTSDVFITVPSNPVPQTPKPKPRTSGPYNLPKTPTGGSTKSPYPLPRQSSITTVARPGDLLYGIVKSAMTGTTNQTVDRSVIESAAGEHGYHSAATVGARLVPSYRSVIPG